MVTNLFRRKKSLSELEEETERKQVENELLGNELSVLQRREAIRQLKIRGLSPKHFGFDFGKIVKWLRTH